MTQKKRAADPGRKAALTKNREELSFKHSIKNMKKKLAIQNPAYKFFFKDGVVQYRKKK